jgi:predicted DNA-binding antitoxin AbrB/MazE fold protein
MKTIRAVYDNNVLRLLDPVDLRQGQRIVVTGIVEEELEEIPASIASRESQSRALKTFLSISGISPALFPDGDWQCRKTTFITKSDARRLLGESARRGDLVLLWNEHEFSSGGYPLSMARDAMPSSGFRALLEDAKTWRQRRRNEQLAVLKRELEIDVSLSDFLSPLSEDERFTSSDGQRDPFPGISGILPCRGDRLLVCSWLMGMNNEKSADHQTRSGLGAAFSYVDLRIIQLDFIKSF